MKHLTQFPELLALTNNQLHALVNHGTHSTAYTLQALKVWMDKCKERAIETQFNTDHQIKRYTVLYHAYRYTILMGKRGKCYRSYCSLNAKRFKY